MSQRTEISEEDFPVEVTCPVCGKSFRLWFNGGEMDRKECHGWVWETCATGYELVTIPPGVRGEEPR